MTLYVGLDVSQKTAAICVVDHGGQRIWRGECRTLPDERLLFFGTPAAAPKSASSLTVS